MSTRQIARQDFRLVNSKYDLNANELKMILNAISEIDMSDEILKYNRITVMDINKELSAKQNHTRLKAFCEDLLKKPLSIPRDHGGWLSVNWFASLEYIPGEGVIEYEISDKLRPYLLELKERFVKTNLKYILPMRSAYAMRIYTMLVEYRKFGQRTFNVAELQELLQVPKSLKGYGQFKQKALMIAQKEINQHTDLHITKIEEIKTGRKVTSLIFHFSKNRLSEMNDLKAYEGEKIFINEEVTTIEKIVEFDGVELVVDVYLNGQLAKARFKTLEDFFRGLEQAEKRPALF